jgi:hypothetical protein
MIKVPSVAQALKDYEAAQLAIAASTKKPQPTKSGPRSNGSAKQSFEPKQPPRMTSKERKTTGPHKGHQSSSEDNYDCQKQVPCSSSIEDASDSEEDINNLARKNTGPSTDDGFDDFVDFGSVSLVSENGDYSSDYAPLISFSQRVSSAALALTNIDYESPASDDSGETEEIPRADLGDIDSPTKAKAMILKSMNMLLEKYQGPQQVTQDLVVRNQLAIQELATRISTAPPTLPVVVEPEFDQAAIEILVKTCAEEGYARAYQDYTLYFDRGFDPCVGTGSKEKLPRKSRWMCAALQEYAGIFWSTSPRVWDWAARLRAAGAGWSDEQMYICLKNDESRYLNAVRNCLFLGKLVENGYRCREVPSCFPWNEQIAQPQQYQQAHDQLQSKFYSTTIPSSEQRFGSATVSQISTQTRKASWLMDDIEYGGGQVVQG